MMGKKFFDRDNSPRKGTAPPASIAAKNLLQAVKVHGSYGKVKLRLACQGRIPGNATKAAKIIASTPSNFRLRHVTDMQDSAAIAPPVQYIYS
mmetsp:Transcript_13267/g.31457  ORF Transcript_13267/g.31457 Transcript_13267/m.31457 type:complete len:93 (-) Transcript_13267:17-295(-)